jgi:predicted dehydrogenase
MNVAIIGCGLIGQKRAQALGSARLIACVDVIPERAQFLAKGKKDVIASAGWKQIINRPDVDIVIIATPHNSLAEITLKAISEGKHILVEKPAARLLRELEPIIKAVKDDRGIVRVGFNHRYHRAFQKAHEIYKKGEIGDLMFIRARYGHGGRVGYEKEWRAKPEISGGGELIDQGVHLIDLARWFLGDFTHISGSAHTYFWDMKVDDNAFLMLKTPKDQIAFLQVSCTEWKNLFSFEIYGKTGKLHIEGLGGSYGVEKLSYYKMSPQMGPPETTVWEYPMADNSWAVEFEEFLEDIRLKRQPEANLSDAYAALSIVQKIYRESGYDHHA